MHNPVTNRFLLPAHRVYIGVHSFTTAEGLVLPSRIRWDDGQEWEIDRVLDVRQAHATKAGGNGTRFLVRIGIHQRALFQQDDGRWFVEQEADPCQDS